MMTALFRQRQFIDGNGEAQVGQKIRESATAKGNPQTKLQGLEFSSSQSVQSQIRPHPENRLPINRLEACSRTTSWRRRHSELKKGAMI
jgi:hypothetical protein